MDYEEEKFLKNKLAAFEKRCKDLTNACRGFVEGTNPINDVLILLVQCYSAVDEFEEGADLFWADVCKSYIYGNDKLDSAVKDALTSTRLGYIVYISLRDQIYYIDCISEELGEH